MNSFWLEAGASGRSGSKAISVSPCSSDTASTPHSLFVQPVPRISPSTSALRAAKSRVRARVATAASEPDAHRTRVSEVRLSAPNIGFNQSSRASAIAYNESKNGRKPVRGARIGTNDPRSGGVRL